MSVSAETAAVIMAVFLLAILNVAGNSLVCVIIMKNQEMRTSVNYLIMNLAIADMIVGILLPTGYVFVNTATHPDGVTGNVLCQLLTSGTWGWIATSTSVFSLVVIAIERYYAVVHPLGDKGRLSTRNIKGVMKMRKRVTLMVVTVSVIFGLCYLPWSSVKLVKVYNPSSALHSGYIMILVNSAINPIVYGLINQQFRKKFRRMMSCTCRPAPNVLHPVREPHDQMIKLAVVSTSSTQ